MNSFWDYLEDYPPPLVRLLARRPISGKHVVALENEEIAIAAGFSVDRVIEISKSNDWRDVTLGEMQDFCKACRFDPTDCFDRNRARAYKERPSVKWTYLKKSPSWESFFVPLIRHLQQNAD